MKSPVKAVVLSAIIMSSIGVSIAEDATVQPRHVRLNREERTVEVDGKICLDEGALELFAVAEGGKEYEALVALKGEPWQLHLSLLLLGLKPGETGKGPRWQGDDVPPVGDPVIIEVEWLDAEGNRIRKRAEDLIWDTHRDAPMPHIEWVFGGSLVMEDHEGNQFYAADKNRCMITVFTDPIAILDNPLDTRTDDSVYVVNQKTAPAMNTPVTIIFRPGTKQEEAEKPAVEEPQATEEKKDNTQE